MANPYDQYKKVQINTANSGQLIILMYEGAIKNLGTALEKFDPSTYDTVNSSIIKAQDIVTELMLSLNKEAGGDLALKLESIYMYINRRLLQANMEKNKNIISEVKSYLESLLEAWRSIASRVAAPSGVQGLGSISLRS